VTVTAPGRAATPATASPQRPGGRRTRAALVLTGLAGALAVTVIVAAGTGQVRVPPAEVLGSLLHRLGLDLGPLPSHPQGEAALWQVRFPRVLLGVVVGAALGCAGAVMQGVFGNPLAEPAVIGVSSGAAVGAFCVIALGLTGFGSWTTAVAAFGGGLLTTFLVYALSRAGGRTEVVTLLLTGIAVNAVAGAVIGLLTYLADDDARTAMAFWNLGSLNRASWTSVSAAGPLVLLGLLVALRHARSLDLLSLGERPARHLGLDVERVRVVLVVAAALLTAAGVAFAGIIAFVGLVVPHLVRMAAGPAHRVVLPGSALGGAVVLVLADLVARTLVRYQELPLGVLTAAVGGPFFFWLLRRTRAGSGGWA
jgi:iron complex transport system permease protein